MNGKLNKILPLAGLFCGSLMFTSVFADTDSDSSSDSQATSTMKEITPPAGFAAEQGIGFSIYADFIYWEARANDLAFATTSLLSTTTTTLQPGEVYYPSFNYKPGFKVGIAFDLGHDNWDLDANYTWLNGNAGKNSVSTGLGVIATQITPTLPIVGSSLETYLTQADGNWDFHHNLINLDLGRNYFISQFLTLRPYFGLSGAWSSQDSHVHYTYTSDTDPYPVEDFVTLYFSQSYWGVGFNTGLQTSWLFDENWSIYGNFGILNLWSKFSDSSKETDYDAVDGVIEATGTVTQNFSSTQYGIQNVLDLELGVRWATTFDDDTMGASIQMGWEQQVWFNNCHLYDQTTNLSMQGLTARLRFDF